jgi:hypothetical protein
MICVRVRCVRWRVCDECDECVCAERCAECKEWVVRANLKVAVEFAEGVGGGGLVELVVLVGHGAHCRAPPAVGQNAWAAHHHHHSSVCRVVWRCACRVVSCGVHTGERVLLDAELGFGVLLGESPDLAAARDRRLCVVGVR